MTRLPSTVPLDHELALPKVGAIYRDVEGRELHVKELEVSNVRGRQVRGLVFPPERSFGPGWRDGVDYSTSLPIWERVWRDKRPSWKGRL